MRCDEADREVGECEERREEVETLVREPIGKRCGRERD